MRPRWRWWLFCVALWLHFRTEWQWPARLMGWCAPPDWLANREELMAHAARVLDPSLEDEPW